MKLKTLLHYLNRRDHHLLPKNFNPTKIILILAVCLTITFPIKTILAQTTDDNTSDEGTTEVNTTTIPTYNNSELMKEVVEKQEAFNPKNINNEVWTESLAVNNAWLVNTVIGGSDVAGMLTDKNGTAWVPGGLIGVTNKAVASLYNPPISGVQYIADSVNSFMGKPAYASGFQQLAGIQSLWKICRDAVYTIISVIFVAMGLMIMLRIKISPQATVTIQNSIPKIIITLILVTFSYAIIGLIIDLSYLVQALILSLLKKSTLLNGLPDIENLIKGDFGTFTNLTTRVIFTGEVMTFTGLSGIVGAIIGIFSGGIPGLVIGSIVGLITGVAILLIFALIQIIKFFFGCAKAYIILLLKIISAPLEIALGAFPNSKMGFSSWLIQTIAYASVFPISLIFLVLLNIILNAVSFNQIWTPGILQGSIISPYIGGVIGLAGLTILAKLPTLIPEAIFKLKPSPFSKAFDGGKTAALASGVGTFAGLTGANFVASKYGYRAEKDATGTVVKTNDTKRGKIIAQLNNAIQYIGKKH